MLNGLEISVLNLDEVMKDNEVFRIDSDYFRTEILNNELLLQQKPNKLLKELIATVKSFGAYSLTNQVNFVQDGIPFLRCLNIKNGVVNFEDVLYIDKASHDILWKSEIKPKMVLVTMSGTVGNATVALETWNYPINSNQDIAKIETAAVNPYFLATFLNTTFGHLQMIKLQAGAIQQHLYLSQIEKLKIPLLSPEFQLSIEQLVKAAHTQLETSKQLYTAAEQLLLQALGINTDTFNPTPPPQGFVPNYSIVTLQDSFAASGRLDAEYYQGKYEKSAQVIKNYKGGYQLLNTICTIKEESFTSYPNTYYKYIQLQNIGLSGEIIGTDVLAGEDLPSRAQRIVNENDVIIASIEGSLQKCAIITDEYHRAICSSGFYVLSSKMINPQTLLVLFKSPIIQPLLKQACSGTILTSINKNDLLNLPIPLVLPAIQSQISHQVQQSFGLQRGSQQLLALAKQAVEVAIEQGEAAALALIAAQTA